MDKDLIEAIEDRYDPDELVDLCQISVADMCEAFPDKVMLFLKREDWFRNGDDETE